MTKSEKTQPTAGLDLRQAADLKGISFEWRDAFGIRHESSAKAICAALAVTGLNAESNQAIESAIKVAAEQVLESVYVLEADQHAKIQISVPSDRTVTWTLENDQGEVRSGRQDFSSSGDSHIGDDLHSLRLPALCAGYFGLSIKVEPDNEVYRSRLIVAPSRCYVSVAATQRSWGLQVRLTSLRSPRNWGVGDFTDLDGLCAAAIETGAAQIFVLEPIQPTLRLERRTFSALSFIDPLYIDVEAVVDYSESEEARRAILAPEFQQRLNRLRESLLVDSQAVREVKLSALSLVYQYFRQQHLAGESTRAEDLQSFREEQGSKLRAFANFQALGEHLKDADWRKWPAQFQDAQSEAVAEFVQSNLERIEFFEYLQWVADLQLKAVAMRCSSSSASIGLCRTLPISVEPSGFEAWKDGALFADGAVGVSPSALADVSGDAALIPSRLREAGYSMIVDAFRQAQRYAGAIYIPDITSLERQLWRLNGNEELVEMHFEFDELFAIAKVESHHGQCLVFASGLPALDRSNAASKSDVFERTGLIPVDSALFPHAEPFADHRQQGVEASAVAPVSMGNQSMVSYWTGSDMPAQELAAAEKSTRDSAVAQRILQRVDVLRQLEERDLLPDGTAVDPASASVLGVDVAVAFYKMIAAESATILMVSLEDLASKHVVEKIVSPYAPTEKLALTAAETLQQAAVQDLIAALKKSGRSGTAVQQAAQKSVVRATIPRATYRFQFNKDFSLKDAQRLIDYLEALGVSHCYASPLLTARPGSAHGYDIVDHSKLNPEIGTPDDLELFADTLREKRIGILLDMVPNHMGIGKYNAWWVDVLENGPASQFAEYFDIDWTPIKEELRGKVTIPVLGEFYGNVLHSGQLKLSFYAERGRLSLRYYENEYPLNPVTYPMVLGERIEILKERLGADDFDVMEYQSIITALGHLPGHMEPQGFGERIRETKLQTRRLSELCKRNPQIIEFIEQNLRLFEVEHGDRTAIQRMHKLLEAQAYRLVHWRVANDEINYRRFFDVNDLAAVRTEDPRVFSEMHALILKWVGERKVDGLRIDHPDGLFDPARYFFQLQQAAAEKLGGTFTEEQNQDLPFYILVEKILAPFERLENWPVQGTTGYDYLNDVLGVLIKTDTEEKFSEIYEAVTSMTFDYDEMKRECKRIILDSVLASELNVLAHRLSQLAESSWYFRDFTLNSLRYALRQVVLAFPVYRTYVIPDHVDKSAYQFIDWAIGKARRTGAANSTAVYDFIRSVLTLEAQANPGAEGTAEDLEFRRAVQTFAMKFQQFTGPVMAKSFEDTLFYRYFRFAGLNEVGGEPDRYGLSVSAFHQRNQQRQQRQPYSMLASSTHDTKRAEDVRARLAVLSELPSIWEQRVNVWMRMNRTKKTILENEGAPDNNDEYLLYQTIVGTYPLELQTEEQFAEFRERIKQYMLKAVREAKRMTSWVNQNSEYETALTNFVDRILTPSNPNMFLDDLAQFQPTINSLGLINSLIQIVLKLTSPGVPDIYQGTELWDFSLVDPDNRRPVDYELRQRMLQEMQPALRESRTNSNDERKNFVRSCMADLRDARIKMYLTTTLLHHRQTSPGIFTEGKYTQLEVTGVAADKVIAFARELDGKYLIVIVPHLVATLFGLDDAVVFKSFEFNSTMLSGELWGDTCVTLPSGCKADSLINLFTSEHIASDNQRVLLSKIFKTVPVAVFNG